MDAEGWVLAGGRSLRMGRDKAEVALAGRPLLEHMLDKLRMLGLRARVAGLRAPVANVAAEVWSDAHPDCGPLSGMETALQKSEAALALMVGVDLPLLEREFLFWMLQRAATTEAMATIPRLAGEPQPLCAVYRRELLGGVTEALNSGDYKVMIAVERASGGRIDGGGVDCFDVERVWAADAWRSTRPAHWQFMNCNTPEDLTLAAASLAGAPML
ncbi:MAG TPA: molybdenum cofactor guanylyltransferase [Acidobacteriaceae bacterium]|nr:molybdenum cofactor guanylyltransferase [Acidobacteriaceae bacterium]